MTIAIHNYLAASHLLQSEPHKWFAIVILDSGLTPTNFVADHAIEHLILRFDDIVVPKHGKRMVDTNAVQSALQFAINKDKLIVSCRAGQSRSAALAYAISFQNNGLAAANSLLNPTRHKPNHSVIELASRFIDDPNFLSAFQRWADQHASIKLMDHLDEIEAEFDVLESLGARNLIVES